MSQIALVDCNNFYVSCERLFQPQLRNKPVVVLSNNDGCIISRSNEAKACGIQMGEPLHLCQDKIKRNQVKVFSSNFTLYGDLSNRVMQVLRSFTHSLEVYSIDEAFLDLSHIPPEQCCNYLQKIQKQIYHNTGIPVSVGLGASKTQAKVAASMAKKQSGTFNFLALSHNQEKELLKTILVEDIWGIGRRSANKLKAFGIYTAYDFIQADPQLVLKKLTVVGSRLQYELRGFPCLEIEQEAKAKKQIISSRSFGVTTTKLHDLESAVALFVSRAAQKLREQNSVTRYISVCIRSNPFAKFEPFTIASDHAVLAQATNSTPILTKIAKKLLSKIFKPGVAYKKAGIALQMISPAKNLQHTMFRKFQSSSKLDRLMDLLNQSQQNPNLYYASQKPQKSAKWSMQRNLLSPKYTSSWQELLLVKI